MNPQTLGDELSVLLKAFTVDEAIQRGCLEETENLSEWLFDHAWDILLAFRMVEMTLEEIEEHTNGTEISDS